MRQPVGFGPFKIVDWKVGESIEYEAFDDYWQGRPKLDRLFIRILPSVDTLMQAIEAKEIDIAWAMPVVIRDRRFAISSRRGSGSSQRKRQTRSGLS